jgi:hypothetical protein
MTGHKGTRRSDCARRCRCIALVAVDAQGVLCPHGGTITTPVALRASPPLSPVAGLLHAGSSIDFYEKLIVEVLTPYQGKIIAAMRFKQGQPLFTIDGPRPLGSRLKPHGRVLVARNLLPGRWRASQMRL